MKARSIIVATSAIAALVVPAAHAATTSKALHCSVQSTRIATARPASLGFRALQSAGKSQQTTAKDCASKNTKKVAASKSQRPSHRKLIRVAPPVTAVAGNATAPAAPPATGVAAAVAESVSPCVFVEDGSEAPGNYPCPGVVPPATGNETAVAADATTPAAPPATDVAAAVAGSVSPCVFVEDGSEAPGNYPCPGVVPPAAGNE